MNDERGEIEFEKLMILVGQGRFQKRFYALFNFFFTFLLIGAYYNFVLALNIPDHWCKVPQPDHLNHSQAEWKNITIPRTSDSFNKCSMYNVSNNMSFGENGNNNINITDCKYGWDYDDTWFESTIASCEDWVCEREIYSSNALFASSFGDSLGTLFVGYLGDKYGRRIVILLWTALLLLGRLASVFLTGNFALFALATAVGSSSSLAVSQTPLLIALEISSHEWRGRAAMIYSFGWASSFAVLAGLYWVLRDWWRYMLVTTLPLVVVLLSQNLLIESPRWLASTGKTDRCVKILKEISEVNGNAVPVEVIVKMVNNFQNSVGENERKIGRFRELFSNKTLIIMTVLMVIGRTVSMMIFNVILFNIGYNDGNPFVNYMLQTLVLLPSYTLGNFMSNTIGRRLTRSSASLSIFLASIVVICILKMSPLAVTILTSFIVFAVGIHDYAVNLHSMEVFPTYIRQTGLAVISLLLNLFLMTTPYIVYMGRTIDERAPYAWVALFGLLGLISAIPAPETLHQNLPETVADVDALRKKNKLFSVPKEAET